MWFIYTSFSFLYISIMYVFQTKMIFLYSNWWVRCVFLTKNPWILEQISIHHLIETPFIFRCDTKLFHFADFFLLTFQQFFFQMLFICYHRALAAGLIIIIVFVFFYGSFSGLGLEKKNQSIWINLHLQDAILIFEIHKSILI